MIASIYQLLHNLFYICQFSCAALALKHRFALLNGYLEKFYSKHHFCDQKVTQFQVFDLRLFTELYNNSCDNLQTINSAFTPQLIIVMIIFMTIEIFGGHGVVQEIISQKRSLTNLIASSIWVLSHYPMKFFMAYSGNSTTMEAEKSLVLISKMIANVDDYNIQHKSTLSILLQQLQVSEKKLSNIFFNIDYNVILVVS